MDEERLEQLVKSTKRAATLAFLCVIVAGAVVVIDQGIKRAILDERHKFSALLEEFKAVANGTSQAGEAGGIPGSSVDSSNGLVRDPVARAGADPAEVAAPPAPRVRKARAADRVPGDG